MLNVKGALDDETEDPVADHLRRLPLKLSARLSVGTPVTVFGRTPRSRVTQEARWRRPSWNGWPNDPRFVAPAPWWVR